MSQQFILVVGDINIPTKAFQIPIQFREIFHPRRISHVILTGNVTSAGTVSFLKTIKSDLHAVRGPYDETSYPDVDTRNYCGYNISVMNGSQCMPMGDSAQLSKFAKVYDSEIICSGCGWRPFVGMVDNVLVVKPGSLTGSIKEHEPGYADDSSYCFSQGSQPGEDASSLTDSDGMKTYVPNPSKVYPYIRYTSEPSFVLLGVSKGSPLVNVFTYIIRDTQLVVSSTKFMVPKLHELPEPQIEMFMHHKSPQEQQLQQPVAFGGLGNPSQTTLPPSSQQFNPYSPSTINAQLGASSQAWQAPPSFQSEGGLSSQQPPNQSTWSSQQVPAPIAAPVQPAPIAAPVQPAPIAAPVQPAPIAAPVQPAPIAAPVQPAKDSTSSTTTPAVSAAPSAPVKTNPYLQAKTSPGANPYLANSAAKPSNPYLKVTNSAASPTSPPTTNPYLKMAGGANETSPYLKKFGDS
ncbi:Vacuolar protein sorting 29 [Giardia lamblia P15]|uniref:Vacuolar protein sorting-associated protein 29 n=1 Tax=Giardia intestinalis (strain P15) TaxID=658858 RepID=E1EYL2_GIAIA|nr:Vacuolar protein sorting 29 [Giardia lamblia P15]